MEHKIRDELLAGLSRDLCGKKSQYTGRILGKKTNEKAEKESVKLTVFVLWLPLQFTANGSLATNCQFFAISNTVQATDE